MPDLFKNKANEKITAGTLKYVKARNRHKIYNLLVREFRKSGLSQADLARLLGKSPETICRILARPRNIEIDTVSELLFAMSGCTLSFDCEFPVKRTSDAAWHAASSKKVSITVSQDTSAKTVVMPLIDRTMLAA